MSEKGKNLGELDPKEKKENLEKALFALNEDLLHLSSVASYLLNAGERKLAEDAYSIDFYNSIKVIEESFNPSLICDMPAQSALSYVNKFLNLSVSPEYNTKLDEVGRLLIKLYATYKELGPYPKTSEDLYRVIGMIDKANDNKDRQNMEDAKGSKKYKGYVLEGKDEIWEAAVMEFRENVKDIALFKSEEGMREGAEKLKTDIQEKINEL